MNGIKEGIETQMMLHVMDHSKQDLFIYMTLKYEAPIWHVTLTIMWSYRNVITRNFNNETIGYEVQCIHEPECRTSHKCHVQPGAEMRKNHSPFYAP